MKKAIKKFLIALSILLVVSPSAAWAFEIQKYDNMPVEGDLVVGPGKSELYLSPGENTKRDIRITNRTGKLLKVNIDIEDFTGDNSVSTKLLGDEKGPYSLKNFLHPEKMSFTMAHGEKIILPIAINIPNDAEPGGLYGAVIIRSEEADQKKGSDVSNEAKGQVSIVSRLASLFFVRVKGNVKEEGKLTSFTSGKYFYPKAPVDFSIGFENTGKIHLTPYAQIDITNLMGKQIDSIDVSPWFVMPGFKRTLGTKWERSLAFGRYTATLKLNRGYGNITDEAKISFWIVPAKYLIIGLSAIVLLALFIWWFTSKFELKKKN